MGFLLGDFDIVELDDGRLSTRTQTCTKDTSQAAALHAGFRTLSRYLQVILTGKSESREGATQTLSRIDPILVNTPMIELLEFRCYAHTHGSIGDWKLPTYQVLVRLRIQKNLSRGRSNT